MRIDVDKDPVRVNKLLGARASIGPIPADQFLPWAIIGGISYFILVAILSASYFNWIAIWICLAMGWWALTGNKTYRFIKSWALPPGDEWINGQTSFVRADEAGTWRRFTQEKPKSVEMTFESRKQRFTPFQNFSHLHSIFQIEMGGHSFACLLLFDKRKDQWSAQIPFVLSGLHPQLYKAEVEEAISSLTIALSELVEGEKLTFHLECKSDIRHRCEELRTLARNATAGAISVLMLDEEKRIQELSSKGIRQKWEQTVWVTWTQNKAEQNQTDNIGKVLLALNRKYQSSVQSFVGTKDDHLKKTYLKMGREIHEYGYLAWRNILETKAQLGVTPMSANDLWDWLWRQFNTRRVPVIPHYIRIKEAEGRLTQQIPDSGQKDLLSVLIQGERGETSCPKHRKQHGYVYCNGKVGKVLVIETAPELWHSSREQIRWIWERLSASYICDTEMSVEVLSRERWSTQDELQKMTRQSHFERKRALEDGTGKSVQADIQGSTAEDALRKLLMGQKPLYVAPVLTVWRSTEREAEEAIAQLSKAFGSAECIAENDITWRVWLETLPINNYPLLTRYNAFSERRITLDSTTVPGLLPLTCPHSLDKRGVEFLSEPGGKPLHIDLFAETGRVLITGKSGAGKSIVGWRFIEDALARNIPVVGIDLSTGGNSTFKTAVHMLGKEKGSYIDILSEKLNLLEPPDLRFIEEELQVQRFTRWKDFIRQAIVAIAMGQINEQQLLERVNSIVLRTLETFFDDAEIIERYNEAIDCGWQSKEWQAMPTLHDFLNFCSKEKLNLRSYSAIDERAINQIHSQVGAKLLDPNVGDAIGCPSSVSPDPLIKFYALSGLTNESNAYIMALSAQMACLRNALAHPKSLFVGDELSVLLGKRGFADLVGETMATGRKEGVSSLLMTQDLDAIVDCSAAAKILANLTTIITGHITHAACGAYIKALNYPKELVGRNATEKFKANRTEMYTRWMIERDDKFWFTRFYSPPLMLAALANSEEEQLARARVLKNYPKTQRGYLAGLQEFSRQYVKAIRGSTRLADIGNSQDSQAIKRTVQPSSRSRQLTPAK